jgi:hypothetical protein
MHGLVTWPSFALALASHGWLDLSGQNDNCACAVQTVSYTFDNDTEGWEVYNHYQQTYIGGTRFSATEGNPPGSMVVSFYEGAVSPIINAVSHQQVRITAQWSRGSYGAGRAPGFYLMQGDYTRIDAAYVTAVSTPGWSVRFYTFEHSGSGPLRIGLSTSETDKDLLVDNVQIEFLETL